MTKKEPTKQINDVEVVEEQLPFPHPENYAYTNAALISMSSWDIRLSFAETRPNSEAISKAGVVMTPAHFKALTVAMFQNLKSYESVYGEIIIPLPKQPEQAKPKEEGVVEKGEQAGKKAETEGMRVPRPPIKRTTKPR